MDDTRKGTLKAAGTVSQVKNTVLFILAIGVLFFLSACVEDKTSPTPSLPAEDTATTPTDANDESKLIVISSAADLNFTIQDFPDGWQAAGEGPELDGHQITVIELGPLSHLTGTLDDLVISWVRVFPSYDEATNAYIQFMSEKGKTYSLDDPKLGDTSFMYRGGSQIEVYFRTKNVLARVTMQELYGGTLESAIEWAKKLEDRIIKVSRTD